MPPILKREACGGDFETTLERGQWGMRWGLNYGVPERDRRYSGASNHKFEGTP